LQKNYDDINKPLCHTDDGHGCPTATPLLMLRVAPVARQALKHLTNPE